MEGSLLDPSSEPVLEGSHSFSGPYVRAVQTLISVVHESCQPDFGYVSRPYEKSTLGMLEPEDVVIDIFKKFPRDPPWGSSLPGSGEMPDKCGVYRAYFCLDEGISFWHPLSCRQRTCPSCFELWGEKEASKASRRVWAGLVKELAEGHDHVVAHHCVVSFDYYGQSFEEAKAQARHVLRSHGSVGEAIVPHPFRNKDDSEDSGHEVWMMDGTVHFHAIAIFPFGEFIPSKKGQSYVFKVIENPHTGRLEDGFLSLVQVKDCLSYQLSHAGVVPGHHAVTWSGSLAYNKLGRDALAQVEEFPTKKVRCPRCNGHNTESQFACNRWYNDFTGRMQFEREWHPDPDDPKPSRKRYVVRWLD